MALLEDVNPVHKLYMELSGRYKAGWTYHRFLQGLRKFFGNQELDDHTADFQELYKGLKEVSLRINDPGIQPVIVQLEELRSDLDTLFEALDEQDRSVDPASVRLFFQRIRTHDERIIIDLVRFFLEVQRGRSWEPERIDKADYLLTRLGESAGGSESARGPGRFKKVLEGLSAVGPAIGDVDPQKLANRLKMIQAVRNEINTIHSFDELTERDLVGHYRNLKHGLGNLLFERSILPIVVDTNLELSRRIVELSESEEARIFEDYEKVSRLEENGQLDRGLSDSVNRLHQEVGKFRKSMNSSNVRLKDMSQIRESVIDVLSRMEAVGINVQERTSITKATGAEDRDAGAGSVLSEEIDRQVVGRDFDELIEGLRDSRLSDDPAAQLMSPRLGPFRLESRELTAFSRVEAALPCDRRLEGFLLRAAALRRTLQRAVEESANYREMTGDRDSMQPETSTAALRLADLYSRQFEHLITGCLFEGRVDDARDLERLRMRLLRDYAGLWLENDAAS